MVKILLCGDVDSAFPLLVQRVATLNASQHGPFDLLICAGLLFKSSEELALLATDSNFSMPIPTYFLPNFAVPTDNSTLPRNVFPMKARGLQIIQGLTVATSVDDDFTAEDLFAVTDSKFRGCDILVTRNWPK